MSVPFSTPLSFSDLILYISTSLILSGSVPAFSTLNVRSGETVPPGTSALIINAPTPPITPADFCNEINATNLVIYFMNSSICTQKTFVNEPDGCS